MFYALHAHLSVWSADDQTRLRLGTTAAIRALHGPLTDEMAYYGNWLRHGLTEAGRENRFHDLDETGQAKQTALISRAHQVAKNLPALRPDRAAGDERILDSICQFDALGGLVAIQDGGAADSKHFYTNFALFDASRTAPVLDRLVGDVKMRFALGLQDDGVLAEALQAELHMAASEGRGLGSWWLHGDAKLMRWIEEHLAPSGGDPAS